jgi:2-phospho-L-lactate/phosphoenolpyruvate guanylyltransferase
MTVSTSMMGDQRTGWVVVVPVKRVAIAKSRLAAFAGSSRSELALAMAMDCVSAALGCPVVDHVVVVTDDPDAWRFVELGGQVLADEPDRGLNPALEFAESRVRRDDAGCPVAALSADLPALRPGELAAALGAASGRRAFVSDAAGEGTTMLAADSGHSLDPRFGPASAAAHRSSGAYPIDVPALASLRRDVDTAADLADAVGLGLGPFTRVVVDRLGSVPGARSA